MPFVRIDLGKQYPDGVAQKIGDIVYEAILKICFISQALGRHQ